MKVHGSGFIFCPVLSVTRNGLELSLEGVHQIAREKWLAFKRTADDTLLV